VEGDTLMELAIASLDQDDVALDSATTAVLGSAMVFGAGIASCWGNMSKLVTVGKESSPAAFDQCGLGTPWLSDG